MASIIPKKIKKNTYYYYVESKRINGKPKLVNQKYLGTAEKLLELVRSVEKPLGERVLYSDEAEFGAVALVYDIADRLGITGIVDSVISKRKQGASIGAYILTAAINRATDPTPKSGLPEWFAGTCLPFITGHKASMFTSQNFWNNTCITADEIDWIEEAIIRKVVGTYQIDTTHIIYDATNFFTYIDTKQGSKLAKRGHSKEKRNDLRIVGLALMVSPEFSIPLLHETYPGNMPDAKEFAVMMERLKLRYDAITKTPSDITVVFDRGNNSETNLDILESGDFKLHYVGGLKQNQAKELFAVDRSKYMPLESPSLKGQSVYRSEMEVFGRESTVVIVYNPELERGQMQGILINREKAEAKLLALQDRLVRRANGEITKGKKPTIQSITAAIEKILSVEYMQDIFSYELTECDGRHYFAYESSEKSLERIRYEKLGKTALFTDRDDFTNEQIVIAYRSAWHVEAAFKQLKNTEHMAVRPIFHWTDEKIRIHIFICVLAYRLCSLLIKELSDAGVSISINRLMDEMSGLKRIHTFFGDLKNPAKVESFTRCSKLATQIEQIYKLMEKYS